MTSRFDIYIEDVYYEITISHKKVISITKYIGESQTPKDVSFTELPPHVQNAIIYACQDA